VQARTPGREVVLGRRRWWWGGDVGCETASTAAKGMEVTVLEMLDEFARTGVWYAQLYFPTAIHGVELIGNARVCGSRIQGDLRDGDAGSGGGRRDGRTALEGAEHRAAGGLNRWGCGGSGRDC